MVKKTVSTVVDVGLREQRGMGLVSFEALGCGASGECGPESGH